MQISSHISLMAIVLLGVLLLSGLPACGAPEGCTIPVQNGTSLTVTGSNISENITFQSIDPVLPLGNTTLIAPVVEDTGILAGEADTEQSGLVQVNTSGLIDNTAIIVPAADTNVSADNFETLYSKGLSLIATGDYEGALPFFEEAVASDLSSDAAWTRYGETQNALGQYAKGYAALKRALDINEHNADAWYGAAISLAGMSRFDEAIPAIKTSFSLRPDDPDILNDLGVILDSTGRYDEAIMAFKGALDLTVTRSEFWNNLGVALFHQGRYYEAIGLFSEALSLDPEFAPALYNKAAALEALGHDEEALVILTDMQDLLPDGAGVLFEKAIILEKMGRYEESDEMMLSYTTTNSTTETIPKGEDNQSSSVAYITTVPMSEI